MPVNLSLMSFSLPSILLDIPRNPVLAVGIPVVLGALLGLPTRKVVKGEWYKNQAAPPGRPPSKFFPILWTGLYASMGWASYLAVCAYDSGLTPGLRRAAYHGLKLYWGQLALNLAWRPIFFIWKQTGLATINAALLIVMNTYMTIVLDRATNHKSSYFLIPYCAWLTFATYLSGCTWWLNKGRGRGASGRFD